MASKLGTEALKQFTKFLADGNGFDRVMKNLTIVSGGNGRCLAELKVQEENTNRGGTLHGGLTATLIDNVTTLAMMSKEVPPGVSVNLNVNYLKAARLGDIIEIDAKTVRTGKRLAYLSCELRIKESGAIVATGTHTKYISEIK